MTAAALLLWLALPSFSAQNFTVEPGTRLSSGSLAAAVSIPGGNAHPVRLYHIHAGTVVFSAQVANDAVGTLTQEAGIRLSTYTLPRVDVGSITALSLLPLDAGGFRMVYAALTSTGTAYALYSATSADGLAWANDTGTLLQAASSGTFVGFPSLVELPTGDWRLYYLQDVNGGNDAADRRVFTALSTNQGRNFGSASQVLAAQAGGVAAALRTDGKVRLYYTAPLTAETTDSLLLSALAANTDGTVFNGETGTRLSTTSSLGGLFSPAVIRTTNTYSWRVYFGFGPISQSTFSTYSAVTYAPEVQGLTPVSVLRDNGDQRITVTGEGFAAAAQATLAGPANVNGLNENTVSDVSLTFDFPTAGQALGIYNLTVTNPNGQAGTLNGSLTVEVPGGDAFVTDNVFRPRNGGRARVDALVTVPGRLTMRLYTIGGELIATIYDGEVAEGTTTVFWDGKTAQGATVASGLYVLHVQAPKLNAVRKIAVIK